MPRRVGSRTQTRLGDRLAVDARLRGSANALVLTEWKVAHTDAEALDKFRQAQAQVGRYSEASSPVLSSAASATS
jgi:hypothetical protein